MRTLAAAWVSLLAALAAGTAGTTGTVAKRAQQQTQQRPPVFRSELELRHLDISVLDRRTRLPVAGLTAKDFTLTEDGVPQPIEALAFVEVASTVTEGPAWAATAPTDVVDNNLDSSRVFVIVIDDVRGMGDLWAKREMRASLVTFVDQLGPDDVAAVVFPGHGRRSQSFTRDKARLATAVGWYADVNNTLVGAPGSCNPGLRLPETMLYVAETLVTMKNRRKAIVFFGATPGFKLSPDRCNVGQTWSKFVQIANAHNISVYPVDTMGLRIPPGADNHIVLANHTGGRALFNTNSFEEGLARIYEENTSYYLLAYRPTNQSDDGRFRRVVVKVAREDAEVRSVRSYWAPAAPTAKRPAPPVLSPEVQALAGVLPRSELPLRAVAAPFRADDDDAAAGIVSLTLGVEQPGFPARSREVLDVLVKVFTPDGEDLGAEQQLLRLSVPAAPDEGAVSRYEARTRIVVPNPGRYELRASVHSAETDARGSIYVTVDVPDFRRERLSLSGVVVHALPRLPAPPESPATDVTALGPTTERAFAGDALVTALLRAYQGGTRRLAPVSLAAVILDAEGRQVFERAETLTASQFAADRSAEYRLSLPVKTLAPGEYLLTITARLDDTSVRRDVKFRVQAR